MFIEAKLILQHYMPDEITKDMWFLGMNKKCPVVYQVNNIPTGEEQQKMFIELNGFPVQPYIYLLGNPNIANDDDIFCTPEEIGWFDEGDHSDEMSDISIKEINYILEYYDGDILVEAELVDVSQESDEHPDYEVFPVLYEGKCVIRYADNEPEEEDNDDDDEYDFDDPPLCSSCNGSGEGSYDGSTCSICGGSGEAPYYGKNDDYEPTDDEIDMLRGNRYYPDIND